MKTSYLIYLIIWLFGIFAMSCSHENRIIEEENQFELKSSGTLSWGLNNYYTEMFPECTPTPYNCFDEIIIKPSKLYSTDNKDDKILLFEEFNLLVSEEGDINSFFKSNNSKKLFPELFNGTNSSFLKKLQNEKYFVTIVRNDNTTFYVFVKSEDNSKKVPEFVFQIREE